jgi:hypothetical protein
MIPYHTAYPAEEDAPASWLQTNTSRYGLPEPSPDIHGQKNAYDDSFFFQEAHLQMDPHLGNISSAGWPAA